MWKNWKGPNASTNSDDYLDLFVRGLDEDLMLKAMSGKFTDNTTEVLIDSMREHLKVKERVKAWQES